MTWNPANIPPGVCPPADPALKDDFDEWLASRKIIMEAMGEWFPWAMSDSGRYAEGILARLAQAGLTITIFDRVKRPKKKKGKS